MSRRAARITHDEAFRMVKAVRSVGLSIGSVTFDGSKLEIVIKNEDSGEDASPTPSQLPTPPPLIREPKL